MKHVNLILQGKGGVGKSFIASLLTQHYIGRQVTPACIDTDPVNQTFAGYKAFTAKRLELMRDGNIDPRAFDQLIEGIMTAPEDAVFIVDNGAATFRSEEHTSELQSLMRISYAVFCLKKKKTNNIITTYVQTTIQHKR